VAIGSVTCADVEDLLKTGMYGVAISSAIAKAVNPIEATRELIKIISRNQARKD
jgi:thiamine monophosphate synthase